MTATASASPEFADLIASAIESDQLDRFHCAIGRVRSYDAIEKTATVEPVTRRPLLDDDGKVVHEPPAPIQNVPVVQLGSGSLSWHARLSAGDTVVLLYADFSFLGWRQHGQISDAGDTRQSGPSYPVAVPWYRPAGAPGDDTESDGSIGIPGGLRLYFGGASVRAGAGTDAVAMAAPTQAIISALNQAATEIATLGGAPTNGVAIAGVLTPLFSALAAVASANLRAE